MDRVPGIMMDVVVIMTILPEVRILNRSDPPE